ncbi:hypothetical protein C8R44DRAFT_851096, partial [Mycena epipterygia]
VSSLSAHPPWPRRQAPPSPPSRRPLSGGRDRRRRPLSPQHQPLLQRKKRYRKRHPRKSPRHQVLSRQSARAATRGSSPPRKKRPAKSPTRPRRRRQKLPVVPASPRRRPLRCSWYRPRDQVSNP